jgi:hypothetical protein
MSSILHSRLSTHYEQFMEGRISFTKEKVEEFKKAYASTLDGGTFMFEGKLVLKDYARYVIEYLEGKFKE